MMSSTDELVVRGALADLVEAQPDAPVDRVDEVRRRHARRRRNQAAAAALCAVATVVGAVLGVGLPGPAGHVTPAHRSVPSWALPWPEHRDASVPPSLLDDAVRAWTERMYGEGAPSMYLPRRVIWYVAAPGVRRSQTVVVFELERDDGDHRLVAGWLNDESDPRASDSWTYYDVTAPDPHDRSLVVSFYLPGVDANGTPDNPFLVLTDPSHHDISIGVPGELPVEARLDEGFAIQPFGPLRQQLHLALSTKHGDVPVGVVGLAGASDSQVPALEPPAELVGVPPARLLSGVAGTGDEVDMNASPPAQRGRTVIYARCYGGPSLTVTVDSQTSKAVTIPCDDRQHVVDGPALKPGGDNLYGDSGATPGHSTEIHADKLIAYRVAVVIG